MCNFIAWLKWSRNDVTFFLCVSVSAPYMDAQDVCCRNKTQYKLRGSTYFDYELLYRISPSDSVTLLIPRCKLEALNSIFFPNLCIITLQIAN